MTNPRKRAMTEFRSIRGGAVVCVAVSALALTLALTPNVAGAQIGNLIKKKAAEKVSKTVENAVGNKDSTATRAAGADARGGRRRAPMQPEIVTIETTTLDSLLRGLTAMTRLLRRSDSLHRVVAGNGGVDSAALVEASRYATDVEQKRGCFDMAFEQMDFQRLQEANRVAHAPSASVERMRAFEEAQIAMDQKRNDMTNPLPPEERRRLVREFLLRHANMRVNPGADTVEAVKECGPAPVISGNARRAARNDTLLIRARAMEQEAAEEGVRASGMPDHRFFVLRERLYIWMKQRDAVKWTDAESGLLQRRRDDLERVRRGILGAEAAGT